MLLFSHFLLYNSALILTKIHLTLHFCRSMILNGILVLQEWNISSINCYILKSLSLSHHSWNIISWLQILIRCLFTFQIEEIGSINSTLMIWIIVIIAYIVFRKQLIFNMRISCWVFKVKLDVLIKVIVFDFYIFIIIFIITFVFCWFYLKVWNFHLFYVFGGWISWD